MTYEQDMQAVKEWCEIRDAYLNVKHLLEDSPNYQNEWYRSKIVEAHNNADYAQKRINEIDRKY